MQYRTLGNSGARVSPLCLGAMMFGGPTDEADSIRIIHRALDQGINFIDTANVYEGYRRVLGSAGGVAEEITGKALKGRRTRAVLATKVGAPVGPGPQDRGLSKTHVLQQLERSLKLLQTDYIDLYIIHWPDKHTPLETTLAAMDEAVRQGKVRYFGASNHDAGQLCELLWLADQSGGPRVVSSQIPYSMLRREMHYDLEFCQRHSVGVTPYQSLQGGLLTGKYRRDADPPEGSRAAEKPQWVWDRDAALYDRLESIEGLAGELDVATVQYTLAWTLVQPGMSSLVVGAKRIDQVTEALGALDVTIPPEHLKRIDQICPLPWRQADPIRG